MINNGKVKLEAWRDLNQKAFTKFDVENIKDSVVAAELMVSVLQRVAHEWIKGGMSEKHCYNLFLMAVKNASEEMKLGGENDE